MASSQWLDTAAVLELDGAILASQWVPIMDNLCLRTPCWPSWDLLRATLVRNLPDSVLLPSHSPFLCQTCIVVWRLSLPTTRPLPTSLICVSPIHLLYIWFHLGVCFLEVCSTQTEWLCFPNPNVYHQENRSILWYWHPVECYRAVKMNELEIKASIWIHLKSTVLSKNNQKSCRVIHTGCDIDIKF